MADIEMAVTKTIVKETNTTPEPNTEHQENIEKSNMWILIDQRELDLLNPIMRVTYLIQTGRQSKTCVEIAEMLRYLIKKWKLR